MTSTPSIVSSKQPFGLVESLVDRLAQAKSPCDLVRVAIDHLTDDAVLNDVVLFTVSRAWLGLLTEQEIDSKLSDEGLVEFEHGFRLQTTVEGRLRLVESKLTGAPGHDRQVLICAATVLLLGELSKNVPVSSTVAFLKRAPG